MTAIQKAREALKPFARFAEVHDGPNGLKGGRTGNEDGYLWLCPSPGYPKITNVTFRNAALALAALDAETPATPADVGELVERLRHHAAVFGDYEGVMRQWGLWRAMIAKGHRGSLPRDAFESLIDGLDKDTAEAATALERVTRERDEARANAEIVCNSYADENQRLHDRAESAEAKLAEARKEADTLRARLETVEAETRERCAAALDEEADLIPCAEDAMVTRSNARLVRADFSYEDAERLESEEAARALSQEGSEPS